MYMYIYIYIHLKKHMYMYVYTSLYIYICVYTYIHVNIHIYIYIHMCIYIYIYCVYTHICIYTYTLYHTIHTSQHGNHYWKLSMFNDLAILNVISVSSSLFSGQPRASTEILNTMINANLRNTT